MSRKRNARSPFDTVKNHLGQLTRNELEDLADIVNRLLAIAGEEDEEEATDVSTNGASVAGARGHVEFKMINGCGPYAYLRTWQGKKLRSHYLGKVGKNGAIIPKGGSEQ